jgi:hypothetical protein
MSLEPIAKKAQRLRGNPESLPQVRPIAIDSPLKSIGNILWQCLPQLKSLDQNYCKIAYRQKP